MGDLEHIPPFSKGVDSAAAGYSSQLSHPPNPSPSSIEASIWQQAEQETQEIIRYIRPTVVSEQRRKVVVEYVQRLIRGYVGSEVFPFGSVPLKTYLPDGDIDLTAIGFPNSEDALASDVRSILEREEHNKDADFEVKDVQYIHAEVRLVKCIVQNIVVDISFSQLGGLCTLCFLEQVDRFIGKDHLFKRSIILIKAWCYYESRILGAHHGLISTYALETLVLYIFHLFHSSLDGPLAVLYRFLDYYSKFDWDKYCISLQGPVFLTSLPDLSVETFDNDGGDLLLTEEFLRSCVDAFSVPVRVSDGNSRTFTKKHLNIVDPLRECNNLGRSVSKGNFYRIRSAFTYGARKLGRLLCLPVERMAVEVNMFFMNTIDRHGGGERPDVQDLVPRSQGSVLLESSGMDPVGVTKLDKEKAEDMSSESSVSKAYGAIGNEMKDLRISGHEECEGRIALQNTSFDKQQNSTDAEVDAISSERLTCDVEDLVTPTTTVLRSMIDSPKASASTSSSSSAATKENGTLDFRNAYHAPHLFFHPENQTKKDLTLDQINTANLGSSCNVPNRVSCSDEETVNILRPDSCENDSSLSSTDRPGNFGSGYPLGNHINGLSSILDEMSDLSGEYEVHFNSLSYAVFCQEQIMNTLFVPMPRLPPYSYYHHGKDVWTRGNVFTRPLSPRPPFSSTTGYSMNLPYISGSYNTDDASKPRGTGTYFPNTNYHVYRERHSPGRAKTSMPANHLPRHQNNCHADASQEISTMEKGSHELAFQAPLALSGNGRGRFPTRMDVPHLSPRPVFRALANASGNVFSSEFGRLEFGSLGPVSVEALTKEHGKRPDFPSSHSQGSGFANPASSSQKPVLNSSRGRALQSYQLKDDEDFPPLS